MRINTLPTQIASDDSVNTTASTEAIRFQAPPGGRLSPAMGAAFQRDGFLILEDFITPGTCEALIERAGELLAGFSPDTVTVFSTRSQVHKSDDYFLQSGDKIRFFFEEDAFDEAGRLRQARVLSINKIGHALHDLDPVFEASSRTPALATLAAGLGLHEPRLLQSMYIFKQPWIGGEVNCHQDATFLYTEPQSCVGFWFALEDATLENGCLHAIPGRQPLRQRFRRTPGGLVMEDLPHEPWPEIEPIPLEVPRGSLVVLDGLLPHLSGPNHSPRSRHAYTLHLIDGRAHYPADNWLQRAPELPLRGFEGAACP